MFFSPNASLLEAEVVLFVSILSLDYSHSDSFEQYTIDFRF